MTLDKTIVAKALRDLADGLEKSASTVCITAVEYDSSRGPHQLSFTVKWENQ